MISYAVTLVSNEHYTEILKSALTEQTRFNLRYSIEAKKKKGLSRNEFLGQLMKGEITPMSDSEMLNEGVLKWKRGDFSPHLC